MRDVVKSFRTFEQLYIAPVEDNDITVGNVVALVSTQVTSSEPSRMCFFVVSDSQNYLLPYNPDTSTGFIRGLPIILQVEATTEEGVFINQLKNRNYSLLKPIEVELTFSENEYIAAIPELNIYAYGKSKMKVLKEINLDITELCEEMASLGDEKLGKKPKQWKAFLNEYIKVN